MKPPEFKLLAKPLYKSLGQEATDRGDTLPGVSEGVQQCLKKVSKNCSKSSYILDFATDFSAGYDRPSVDRLVAREPQRSVVDLSRRRETIVTFCAR